MLRAKQLGLTIKEMDELEEGMVFDLLAESANDHASDSYSQMATQEDFDRF